MMFVSISEVKLTGIPGTGGARRGWVMIRQRSVNPDVG
jgi:hypothetical protein|nr:hypothetical protein [Aeromicrobium sp.]